MKKQKILSGIGLHLTYEEFDTIIEALKDAECLRNDRISYDAEEKYRAIREGMENIRNHIPKPDDPTAIVNCMTCRHCLPPSQREWNVLCRLDKCRYDPA